MIFKVNDYIIPKDPYKYFPIDYIKIIDSLTDKVRIEYKAVGLPISFGFIGFESLYREFKLLIEEPEFIMEELP